ncbi:kinase-like domain-containing protein [Rhizoctonia solani]|nr:kinase-like domain-containing protein [Rhizoctonia solani]
MQWVRDTFNFRPRSTRRDSREQTNVIATREDLYVAGPNVNQNVVSDISNAQSDQVTFTGRSAISSPNVQSSVTSSSASSYNVRPSANIRSDDIQHRSSPNVVSDLQPHLPGGTSRTFSTEPFTRVPAAFASVPTPTQMPAQSVVSTLVNERGPDTTVTIRGTMPISDVIACLGDHGCLDLTDQVIASSSSKFPFATGGFGDVYCGSLRNGSRVSLKCIRLLVGSGDEGRKQLKHAARELYIWSKCQHPNVLELLGVAKFRDQIAMVSPWMEQGNLCWYISQNPHVERYGLCVQVSEGVAYLHGEGTVHGDIKGANVLVSQDGYLKLTDFGNATLHEYTLKFTSTTSTPSVSMRWAAPEVVLGEVGISAEADVYALGMTLLEVITGAVPYNGLGDIPVFGKIIHKIHPVRPEADLPSQSARADSVWSLLTSCWSYNAQERPTASTVRDEMKLIAQASF